jgi:hypothetical protein
MTEDQFQAKCFEWAWNAYPQTRRLIWAVPNGAWFKNFAIAQKMKATGLVAGVSDLHFVWDGTLYCFELKVSRNVCNELQIKWQELTTQQGVVNYVLNESESGFERFKYLIAQIVHGNKKPNSFDYHAAQ